MPKKTPVRHRFICAGLAKVFQKHTEKKCWQAGMWNNRNICILRVERNRTTTVKHDMAFLIKLKASICCMSAISFLGLCPGKTCVLAFLETYVRMLISALFTMEKMGKINVQTVEYVIVYSAEYYIIENVTEIQL